MRPRDLGALAGIAAALALACAAAPDAAGRASPDVSGPAHTKLEEGLAARLASAPPTERFLVLADLSEQVDLESLAREAERASLSKAMRRERVIEALERVATRQQAALRPVLDRLRASGAVDRVRTVAIVNRLIVRGTAAGILELARQPAIARVLPEWRSGWGAPPRVPVPATDAPEIMDGRAVGATGAKQLWAQGLDGTGVVVAAIDTGVAGGHEQLVGRQLPGERGWFDAVGGGVRARDSHGHGTAVLSLAVGANGGKRVLGVAPGAAWAVARANWRNRYSRVRMTLAADWVLRVARPDVLLNAWVQPRSPCDRFDEPFLAAWHAAGIFVVFPAGNGGPGSCTGTAPAQLGGVLSETIAPVSVGALGADGRVAAFSSRGPSRCADAPFPTLVAPGSGLVHAWPGAPDRYARSSGTSLAAAIVAGGAALLLQRDPSLEPDRLAGILRRSAVDVPPAGEDPSSGAGRLFLPRALEMLLDDSESVARVHAGSATIDRR